MNDTFTFPSTPAGAELRLNLMNTFLHHGMAFRVFEENWEAAGLTFRVLRLEKLGKRPGEGQIAQAMKARKHGNN